MNTSQQPTRRPLLVALSMALVGTGCATVPGSDEIRTESYVDLDRFMGEWYVIASIPTALEKDIYNATETYRLDDDYSQTIIGRNKRDYAWIMARTPTISPEELFEHITLLREQGYDTDELQLVPQRWDGVESTYNANAAPPVIP
ncbi:MAG: lipocalin family protein [Gammaproteobacteria bacterium]|nr:lipocalin family protein [Gammaproteobacteria bacterium]